MRIEFATVVEVRFWAGMSGGICHFTKDDRRASLKQTIDDSGMAFDLPVLRRLVGLDPASNTG